MNFCVLIPARMASTRLPGKVLLDVGGLPMIEQVRRRALESGAARVVVATDHEEVMACVQDFGGEAVATDPSHHCGSERLAEAARLLALPDEAIIVNLQGDEPLMDPALLAATAALLETHPHCPMATAAVPIRTWSELANPHVVKVVMDRQDRALYFSRAPIPWDREHFPLDDDAPLPGAYWRHLGLYAYRSAFLQTYAAWAPTPLERGESLEQLRALEHGVGIAVHRGSAAPAAGVDTAADLERLRAHFSSSPKEM